MTTQQIINKINLEYPPNSIPIKYKDDDGKTQEAKVRFPPEVLECGKPVIWLQGLHNAIELKNVIL